MRGALGLSSVNWNWHEVWPSHFTQVWQKAGN